MKGAPVTLRRAARRRTTRIRPRLEATKQSVNHTGSISIKGLPAAVVTGAVHAAAMSFS